MELLAKAQFVGLLGLIDLGCKLLDLLLERPAPGGGRGRGENKGGEEGACWALLRRSSSSAAAALGTAAATRDVVAATPQRSRRAGCGLPH